MSRPVKISIALFFGLIFAILLFIIPQTRALITFFALQASNAKNAGVWEDDPKNWSRAFGADQPAEISVIHSKYWKSNHFTDEFAYFFEVQASPEWKNAFLKQLNVEPVPASKARGFRVNSDLTPSWFTPDPIDAYEVWDKPGHSGSVWITKTNGHMFFFAIQL